MNLPRLKAELIDLRADYELAKGFAFLRNLVAWEIRKTTRQIEVAERKIGIGKKTLI